MTSGPKTCPTCGTKYELSVRFCPSDGSALRSADASADLLGQVIADRYYVLKKLGEGGMGTVYLAEHVKMGRKSALKVMNPGMNTDPDAIARFNREASNASRLSHPNICGVYDFGETPEGLIYLVMEFIEGTALADLIKEEGSLAPARAASIVHQTADALQVAHDAGIVHRDLKPDNIMIATNRDGTDQVKVVDFGLAKASSNDAQRVTKTGRPMGTPEYVSPEQLLGEILDGRSDTYSLGLVAYNCITGKLPFPSESAQEAMMMRLTDRPRTLAELAPDTAWPDAVQATLDRALARDAAARYQSAAQFGREFVAAWAPSPSDLDERSRATQLINPREITEAVPRGRTFAMYWIEAEIENAVRNGVLRGAVSAQFQKRKVTVGDRIWIWGIRPREKAWLETLGFLDVGEVIGTFEARRRQAFADSEGGTISDEGRVVAGGARVCRAIRVSLKDMQHELEFLSAGNGVSRLPADFSGQHLQSIRMLTPAAAEKLFRFWRRSGGLYEGEGPNSRTEAAPQGEIGSES